MNILLVEPDYRSKFPPLGLMKISSYHKGLGDAVTFVRGKVPALKSVSWHRIYISSLFTYELPRTVETIKYYIPSVSSENDIIVGGIGATLFPDYIKERVKCRVIEGPLDKPNILDENSPPIETIIPDYSMLKSVDWKYQPDDAYFCRITKGCIRKCKFCAVPVLEPEFGFCDSIKNQITEVDSRFGGQQNLVILDNNVLAIDSFETIIKDIRSLGFKAGAKKNNKKRYVDFNQGIDARLITSKNAKLLSSICLSPVRLAFDHDSMEVPYRNAIRELAREGFVEFTNYIMFNYEDTPLSFYNRLKVNIDLFTDYDVRVTGFPMKYVPINDITRQYISKNWRWRYLRGIQCILHATRGLVSPNPSFFEAAFGATYEEFLNIISMPDHYIIHRNKYKANADNWNTLYKKLSEHEREDFLLILEKLNKSTNRISLIKEVDNKFKPLIDHYYPDGKIPKE
jgi:hypothetical protein